MSKMIILILLFFIIGLSVGYAIFGQAGDSYIPIKNFVTFKGNHDTNTLKGVMQSLGNSIGETLLDMKTRRRNILITGLAGGLLGAVLYGFTQKKR